MIDISKKVLKIILPPSVIVWLNQVRENARFIIWRMLWSIREQFYPEKYVSDPYVAGEIYWVNPSEIQYRTIKEFNYYKDHNKVVGGNWDTPLSDFDEEEFYIAYQEILRGKKWSDTHYYKNNLKDINEGKIKWGCRSQEEWQMRCKKLDQIYYEIKFKGYRPQKLEDHISVNVGRSGDLLFNDGRHRLTFCKILQLNKIPVRITVRHSKWVAFKRQIFDNANARENRKGKVYAPLTHIDLKSIPSNYGEKRFEMIKENLSQPHRGNVLDFGAHWGYFCHKLEMLGYDCIAVENDVENLYFLEKLKRAQNRKFRIVKKSILFYDFSETIYNIVLALNIFHHLIKDQTKFDGLIKLLSTLHMKEMYFEPPDPNELQMQTSYRNYECEDFAKLIIENSELNNYKEIGKAEDGRVLYKLWKESR